MNPRDILSRPATPPDFTVAYGDHPDHIADVRRPAVEAGLPLVIFIHGGFWMAEFDRTHAGPLAVALAELGYPVATLEYRRVGGGGGWPTTFDDVAAGVAGVPKQLARTDVVLMGHSAGGQLALWAARNAERGSGSEPGAPRIRGVVALAPVADMARGYALGLDDGAVTRVLGGSPEEVPDRYASVDPAANLPVGVPVAVVHGHADQQVPYAIGHDFAVASKAAGDSTSLFDLPDIEHFGIIDPHSSAWPTVVQGLASVCNTGRG